MFQLVRRSGKGSRCVLRAVALPCALCAALLLALQGCAGVDVPGSRNVNIPKPTVAEERRESVNEGGDSVIYLPLGRDVLVPLGATVDNMPRDFVGPYELRNETLAGALQLILADYDVSLAFESTEGMTRTVTVANLRGPLHKVVQRVCSLADLYCAYEDDMVVVKETQTFTVKVPPISDDTGFITNVASGLQAITGRGATIDTSTRTIVYEASHRTAEMAERYFQRMRASTALIVFETYIWEVNLNSDNATGIRWDLFEDFGKFTTGITFAGTGPVSALSGNQVSIGIPTTQSFSAGIPPARTLQFISRFGTTKTISQPQLTVLSGSSARFRAATADTFVSSFSETIDGDRSTVAVSTGTIDSGLNMEIASAWDNATVYADISIILSDANVGSQIPFGRSGDNSFIQLPESTERELETQVRVRPGDSILIAGLVQEGDNYNKEGFGFTNPFIPYSRVARTSNTELVFLLRPRVVVYTSPDEAEYYESMRGQAVGGAGNRAPSLQYDFSPFMDEAPAPAAIPLAQYQDSGAYRGGGSMPVVTDYSTLTPVPVEESAPMTSVPVDLLNPGGY